MATNPQPRKHHYLPAYYLRGFSPTGDSLYRLDRDTGAIIGARIKDLAAERDFHILDGENVPDRQAVEKELSVIEGQFANFQVEMLAGGMQRPETLAMMMRFVSMMRMRIPAMKDFMAAFTADVQQAQLDALIKSGKMPIPDVLKPIAKAGDLRVSTTNTALMQFMFTLAFDEDVLKYLDSMKVTLLQAPFGTRFIVSDQPVSLYHPNPPGGMGVGLITPGVELALPLSSRYAMLMTLDPGENTYRGATADEINELNRRTFLMASKYVFSGESIDEFEPLVEKYRGHKYGFQFNKKSHAVGLAWLSSARAIGPA